MKAITYKDAIALLREAIKAEIVLDRAARIGTNDMTWQEYMDNLNLFQEDADATWRKLEDTLTK